MHEARHRRTIRTGEGVWNVRHSPTNHRCIAIVSALPSSTRRAGSCGWAARSEEHTSELQSLMRISYAVFCLKTTTHEQHFETHEQIRNRQDDLLTTHKIRI